MTILNNSNEQYKLQEKLQIANGWQSKKQIGLGNMTSTTVVQLQPHSHRQSLPKDFKL
jgi:hypothetical protein